MTWGWRDARHVTWYSRRGSASVAGADGSRCHGIGGPSTHMFSPFDGVTVHRLRALVASERKMSTPTAAILQPGEQQPSKQLRCATRMFRLHAYHTRLVFMLACVVTFGILVSSIYSLNHFNLLLSSKRALDFSAFRELEREVPSICLLYTSDAADE